MTTGTWVLVVAVGAAVVFGLWRAWSDGRFRGTHEVRGGAGIASSGTAGSPVVGRSRDPNVLAGTAYAGELGERATLLQFSSAFCAPCRAARQTLALVAGNVPGVAHVEIDAEHHLELVRRLGVSRTPTTLVLDAAGREATRATGAPRPDQVLSALDKVPGLG